MIQNVTSSVIAQAVFIKWQTCGYDWSKKETAGSEKYIAEVTETIEHKIHEIHSDITCTVLSLPLRQTADQTDKTKYRECIKPRAAGKQVQLILLQ